MNKLTKQERVFVEVHKDYDYTVETSGGYFHLKEQNNKYLLDEEQIIKLINEARQDGINSTFKGYSISNEEYAKQILNN